MGFGGKGGKGGKGGGFKGGGKGGKGGGKGFSEGPPESVVEVCALHPISAPLHNFHTPCCDEQVGTFEHACEGDMVLKSTNEKVRLVESVYDRTTLISSSALNRRYLISTPPFTWRT